MGRPTSPKGGPSELELHLDPEEPVVIVTAFSPDVSRRLKKVRVKANNETGQLTSGNHRLSKTWVWTDGVYDYRVQVQATLREEHRP
jgi:hypothetical protein